MEAEFDTSYTFKKCGKAYRFRFYCELTGIVVCQTKPIDAADEQSALMPAKELARPFFNRCSKCGRWVCDHAYNIDEMSCTCCSPLRYKPNYCTKCGSSLKRDNQFCTRCGHKAIV